MKKRVIVQRLEVKEDVMSRVEKLTQWSQAHQDNTAISLRVYTSQDDETILVEKWGFADEATEKAFFSSQDHDLGPWDQGAWPESDHADGHGRLMLFSEKEWDE